MSVASNRKPVKPKARPDLVVSLALAIDHQVYDVVLNAGIQDPDVIRSFRLIKHSADGQVYDVSQHTAEPPRCTCPDFECRRRGLDPSGCKHIKACVRVGLIEPFTVAPTPAPVPCCTEPEVTPCVACLAAPAEPPAVYADEAPELSDAAMFDPEDIDPANVETDPSEWPACPEVDGWFATPIEPDLEPEPAIVPGVDSYQSFRPTAADLCWNAASTAARPSLCKPTRTRVRFDRPL